MNPLASLSKWRSLDEVVRRFGRALLRDGLVDGQKDFERDALVRFQLHSELLHVRLGRVLAERSQTFADLLLLDLAIATVVEQIERLLEFSQLILGEISHFAVWDVWKQLNANNKECKAQLI